jgi:hypothetical protein
VLLRNQVVFTIPRMLRIFFKYNRRLLGELCHCALRSLIRYFAAITGSELRPGVIAAIQTFGTRINFHPHLHFLVTEGGVDESGTFHRIPRIDDSRLAELFAHEVLITLVRKQLLSPEWAENEFPIILTMKEYSLSGKRCKSHGMSQIFGASVIDCC